MTNARDKTYTGKVSEWGLPDGTMMACTEVLSTSSRWVVEKGRARQTKLNSLAGSLTCKYKIVSLPAGYKFNDAGEIVKEDKTRSAESTAIKTLESLGYKWNGGEYWRPPLGKAKIPDVEKRYWDGNEPLEVGMWFSCAVGVFEALIVTSSEIAFLDDGVVATIWSTQARSVDTRTEKEKAVDKFLADEINVELSHSGRLMLERAYDKWVGNDE